MIDKRPHLFTSESVTEGHPDKMADQISDAVLDAILEKDKKARVAIECLLKTGMCLIAGEIKTHAKIDYSEVSRKKIKDIGYNSSELGFDYDTCSVLVAMEHQSPDIAKGIDEASGKEQGAGDQGLMFGFAINETPELMPLPITYAHRLAERLAQVRKSKIIPFLGPDGKTQVTVLYENGKPKGIDTIVVSSQHYADVPYDSIKEAIIEEVIKKVIKQEHMLDNIKYHINPTGSFVTGGPKGDTGLTGRKIIVDTYGGMSRHGGGAFSGKDPSKVDRSASYLARYMAKNVVGSGLAHMCEIQIAYAIGVSEPISLLVNTFGTGQVAEEKIEKALKELVPLRPKGLIEHLNLLRPIYSATASYGHFGRPHQDFTWERLDIVDKLRSMLS